MKGLVHLYTGNGKGKTTASVGLAVRAVGAGKRVALVQFLKGMETSEIAPLISLGVDILREGKTRKFVFQMTPQEREKCRREQNRLFDEGGKAMETHDMVIFDEIGAAISTGMVDAGKVEKLIREKPDEVELVLTGRDVPDKISRLADYVSEIVSVRHPYDRGVRARKGIEF